MCQLLTAHSVRYDLKGSTKNRSARDDTENHTGGGALLDVDYLKDAEDWRRTGGEKGCPGIQIDMPTKRRLMAQLICDVRLLASEGVIDYSMLICRWSETKAKELHQQAAKSETENYSKPSDYMHHGLHAVEAESGEWFMMSIIDISRQHGCAETVETSWKTCMGKAAREDVTVLPPTEYGERFLRRMDEYILPQLDQHDSLKADILSLGEDLKRGRFQQASVPQDAWGNDAAAVDDQHQYRFSVDFDDEQKFEKNPISINCDDGNVASTEDESLSHVLSTMGKVDDDASNILPL